MYSNSIKILITWGIHILNRIFNLKKNNTTITTEIIAGFTSFISVAYILGIMPNILMNAGVSPTASFVACAIISAITCILFGILSNYPIAMGPSITMASIVTYSIVITMGKSYEYALACLFISAILLFIITISGFRKKILDEIPFEIKIAMGGAIGFFLAFVGLQNSHIIIANTSTLVSFANIWTPTTILSLIGLLITFILYLKKIPFALCLSLFLTALIGISMTSFGFGTDLNIMPHIPQSIISFKLDFSLFGSFYTGFKQLLNNPFDLIIIIFSLLFVSLFDATSSLISVANHCGFTDDKGEVKNIQKAFITDSIAAILASIFGIANLTVFAESISGAEVGGKTGLTPIICGILYLLSLFFAPIILSLFTSTVTCSILIIIGVLMMAQLKNIDWDNLATISVVFITIIMTVLTYSITIGIAFGFITFTISNLIQKKKTSCLVYILTILFLIYLFIGL